MACRISRRHPGAVPADGGPGQAAERQGPDHDACLRLFPPDVYKRQLHTLQVCGGADRLLGQDVAEATLAPGQDLVAQRVIQAVGDFRQMCIRDRSLPSWRV